ncbi:hypothetical protein LY90DRAFT_392871 [Neocallimastix californiae]|jgi:expansin (peptidoglycan-binding protein)|uniref:Expansin-like EG45 domain-containing protein n=1 Tax=Neocallimastix californiae TaxID=1754190 RepID=A0A1Y1ZCE9_9FUNG|nr:hypothetical protein LY90DRAFT_392871 [Neocallimastix californiae]|eukprot:ORY07896.1 hypothetical protein LY90DRAFT_392871 [Neocallimastix californiae]
MKFLNNLIVNSLLLSIAKCGVIKRSTGNISDFSSYSGISELIQANRASFQGIFKDGPIYSGEGTAYGSATNGGNCLFPKEEYYKDMMYAALNHEQYINDLGCGACALVVSTSNPYKPIRIRVIDQCPECKHGDLDFSDKAYKALTNQSPGRVKITWALIPCDIAVGEYPPLVSPGSDIKFQFKTGSSATWTEVQVFNTRYPVAKFEAKVNGNYVELKRRDYNYWSNGAGLGAGPFDFRVTLADGSVIDATGVEFAIQSNDEDGTAASGRQTVSGGSKSSGGNVGGNVPQAPTNQSPNQNSPINNNNVPNTKTLPDQSNNTPPNNIPLNNTPLNNTPPNNTPPNNTPPNNTPPNNTPSTGMPNIPGMSNNPTISNTNSNTNINTNNSWGNWWGNNNGNSWNPWGSWNNNDNKPKNSATSSNSWGFGNFDWMKPPSNNAATPSKPQNNNWWIRNQW